MIPNRMSFFWMGGPLSWMRYMTLFSFRKLNPDWEVFLYYLPVAPGTKWAVGHNDSAYRGKDYLPQAESLGVKFLEWKPPIENLSPAHASGLMVWDTLSTVGGWCSDMDILYIRPMGDNPNSLLCRAVKTSCTDVVLCNTCNRYIATAFLGASPENPLFRHIYDKALANYKPDDYQCVGPLAVYVACEALHKWGTRPDVQAVCVAYLRNKFPQLNIVQLPDVTVYPWNWLEIDYIFCEEHKVGEETIGIHWFGGRREMRMWYTVLNGDTYRDAEVTFTHYAKGVIDRA